ncbi:tRNA dihydrouridine synthase DusB [Dactylosporangium sp. NPDC000555]|uniref:tRNA dihydrouridine synthase DusB n=1 Tax=Dactylosporangium sp. NPDC000555 TaxID=3154260 RepID=UPI003332F1E7
MLGGVPLQLGPHVVDPPVVLAPMAGITNVAFRRLCREQGAGLYVCEMITTRALVERNPKTMSMIRFGDGEHPRSLQLYGVDPATIRKAVEMVVEEDLADHIDMNFGCSVPKVTRRGGGSALPWKRRLFASIVSSAVEAAQGLPVTVKMRIGIDEDHHTFLDAALTAQDAGVAWVALHARTAAQRYSGSADWSAIAELKQALSIPVLGNGDIWEATDALRMMSSTGCDGVVIGRGCLGRPWLFADLAAAFAGRTERVLPSLGEVHPRIVQAGITTGRSDRTRPAARPSRSRSRSRRSIHCSRTKARVAGGERQCGGSLSQSRALGFGDRRRAPGELASPFSRSGLVDADHGDAWSDLGDRVEIGVDVQQRQALLLGRQRNDDVHR